MKKFNHITEEEALELFEPSKKKDITLYYFMDDDIRVGIYVGYTDTYHRHHYSKPSRNIIVREYDEDEYSSPTDYTFPLYDVFTDRTESTRYCIYMLESSRKYISEKINNLKNLLKSEEADRVRYLQSSINSD